MLQDFFHPWLPPPRITPTRDRRNPTSTTKDNPGKEFRVYPNSTEWVNEDDTINNKKRHEVGAQSCEVRAQSCEVRTAIMDHDFNIYKKKIDEEFDKMSRKISSLTFKNLIRI
ncbi:unnamed protein product [Lactuca saligna]|uniref:Uncharacterized protein n=1 Tax=Lactuca saligna TaxID=75948 RepID=A0AA35V8J5_LACSI|nr:unnamed protein product [Lactuca saligna]